MKLIDLAGTRFTRLVVLERAPSKNGTTYWKCRCDCGNEYTSTGGHLKSGNIKSCGCLRHESQYDAIEKDPNCVTRVRPIGYETWAGLKQRCYNPKNPRYIDYGGRGITICDRWMGENGFINFLEDMGPRPTPKHSLDRENINGPYSKDNCKWATDLEQGQNTTRTKNVTYRGNTMAITAWERELGFNIGVLHSRLKNGWSVEEAFTTPSCSKIQQPDKTVAGLSSSNLSC